MSLEARRRTHSYRFCVAQVLDVLASQLSNGADKAALQSKPDAAALSVYVHAFTQYSAGDAPEGRSLRSWFADSGSRLYRARANTSMRPSSRDGRSSADTEISFACDQKRARNSVFLRSHGWRQWMDAYPYVDSGLGAIREDAIVEEPEESAAAPPNPLARFSSTSDLDNELSMAQLNRVGWSVNLAWPRCLLITPLAYFAVSPPVRSGDLRIWLLSDMVKLYRPDMKQWGVWGFLLGAIVNAISVLFMLFYRESLSGPSHIWQGIQSLVIMITYGTLYFIKVRTDWRNWRYVLRRMKQRGRKIRMPTPPLWPTGKLGAPAQRCVLCGECYVRAWSVTARPPTSCPSRRCPATERSAPLFRRVCSNHAWIVRHDRHIQGPADECGEGSGHPPLERLHRRSL